MLCTINPRLKAQHGLELSEVFLLQYIRDTDMNPSDIAQTLQIPAHAVSRRLDSLEKRTLLERSLDPNDARRRVLKLTELGTELLQQAGATLDSELQAMLNVLSPTQQTTTIEALEKIGQAYQEEA